MKKYTLLCVLAVLCAVPAFAQGGRYDSWVVDSLNRLVANPTIRVCPYTGPYNAATAYVTGNTVTFAGGYYTAAVNSTNSPPSTNPTKWTLGNCPTTGVLLYADKDLTFPQPNPFLGDSHGNYGFFAAAGTYTVQANGYAYYVTISSSGGVFTTFNGIPLRGITADFWGDSITATCFDGCSNRWADQFSTSKGWTEVNHAVSGASLEDQATVMYATTVTSGMRNFMLIGQNNGGSSVGTQARKDYIIGVLEAAYAYLLTPNKVNASTVTTAGAGWGANSFYAGGRCTSGAGDTMTFTLDGTDPMVAIHKTTTSTSLWTANMDGVTYGPFDAIDPYTTAQGTTHAPWLFHPAGQTKAAHTIILTNVSGGPFCVDWGASNSNQGSNSLVVGSPYNTTSNPEAVWRDWESVVRQATASIAQAGLGVTMADTRGACMDQTGAQLCTDHGDGIHPGLVGDGILFTAFAKATQLFSDPRLPSSDRFYSYKSRSFKGLGPWQVTDFWSGNDIRDGGGISTFGQYSYGGVSNATGGNQGGMEFNIGGSQYAAQSNTANIVLAINSLWGTTGAARIFQISGAGNIIAGNFYTFPAQGQLEVRNGTQSQLFVLNHTYTDSSNYENFTIDWGGTSGAVRLFMNKAGTGASRALQFGTSGAVQWEVATGGIGPLRPITDNSADLGGAANRPKKIWVAQTIASGTASNSDLGGQVTLVAGSGTYTFAGTYTSAPICTATDTTAASAVRVSATTTVLTLSGTGTDVINYNCHGRN